MRMKSTNALLLGIAIGAVAVGATTAVSANGGSTITACAKKSTGAMRYVSKGSCKKTETKVSWNSQGPIGVQGPVGPQGPQGNSGVNSTSSSGTDHSSVFDSNGRLIGQLVDVIDGVWYDEYKVARNGVYFHLGSDGGIYGQIYFDQPNCVGTAFSFVHANRQWPRQLSTSEAILTLAPNSQTVRWYRPNSRSLTLLTPASVLSDTYSSEENNNWIDQLDGIGTCTNLTGQSARLHRTVQEISPIFEFTTNSPLKMVP